MNEIARVIRDGQELIPSVSAAAYHGAWLRGSDGECLWQCEHVHQNPDEARKCAEAALVDLEETSDMNPESVIINALGLAEERVTGELNEKRARKYRLRNLADQVSFSVTDPHIAYRPSAAELRDALGDPDDKELRRALDAWDEHERTSR